MTEKCLCGRCVIELKAEGKKLVTVYRGNDEKVICERCGRRRYGGKYEVK